ncbi:MAG: CCA tRNA nucleotidyltransferase [Pleurocapsa sp.]
MTLEKLDLYLASFNLPCDLTLLPSSAYLVGGSVRDALLNRPKDKLDLDFVLPEKAVATAREIARQYHGGFVVLDEAREIARVVFEQGTLDLALQEGNSLEIDLQRRDFTINAIAYNFSEGKLIDPLGGIADLAAGIIRMVAGANLKDDPLRLLRAYRQAAQLDFTIEENTRRTIRSLAPLLTTVAAERIQAELNYIFLAPGGSKWLTAAWEDSLLQPWLATINAEKLARLTAVETIINHLSDRGLIQEADKSELLITAKLATLVSPTPEIAETELTQLKYSRSRVKAVSTTVRYLPQLQNLTSLFGLKEQYFFFLEIKNTFPLLIISAIATGVSSKITESLIERYLNPQDPVAHPQPLVTGNDLIQQLNLKPSPVIGKLLTAIQIAYIEDKISTPSQAIEFAYNWIINHPTLSG